MARLTNVYGCDGCDYMTRNRKDLRLHAKVKIDGEGDGKTVWAHTPECLETAVRRALVQLNQYPAGAPRETTN
jgi:hypothetical protein